MSKVCANKATNWWYAILVNKDPNALLLDCFREYHLMTEWRYVAHLLLRSHFLYIYTSVHRLSRRRACYVDGFLGSQTLVRPLPLFSSYGKHVCARALKLAQLILQQRYKRSASKLTNNSQLTTKSINTLRSRASLFCKEAKDNLYSWMTGA